MNIAFVANILTYHKMLSGDHVKKKELSKMGSAISVRYIVYELCDKRFKGSKIFSVEA